jgi:hypothetical protein
MRGFNLAFFSCLLCLCFFSGVAQTDSTFRTQSDVPVRSFADTVAKRYKISVLAPLYLDSAFDAAGNYRFSKTLPKFIAPGLEFYEGVQLAVDSLRKEGVSIDVNIFDTRAKRSSLAAIFSKPEFGGTDVVIAHVNMPDAQWLAHTAKDLGIPFVNVNFPNEAGVTDNPQYIILNSTLFTHCEGLYKFMQKNYALSPITVFRKKGAQEDRLNSYLREIEKTTSSVPLKLRYVTLSDNFTPEELSANLDGDKTNIIFAASLDVNFGSNLAEQLSSLSETHAAILIGMPNWDAINFSGSLYKGLEIIYSTPFYIAPSDSTAAHFNKTFAREYYLRPGEMVFRGYETVYQFAHLLLDNENTPLQQKLSRDTHKVFYDFNIVPVINKRTGKADYYENKKLFFVKKLDGQIKAVY